MLLCSTFSTFLESPVFGIMAMVIVGSSWCLAGLIMGDAPKKKIDTSLVQFFGAFVSVTVSLILGLSTVRMPDCSFEVFFWACGALFTGAFINFFMMQLMSEAMQKGPNGVIWAIIQSALIFPFIGGIVFFDVVLNFWRGLGIVLLLSALVFFGMVKSNNRKGDSSWKRLAFAALAICAVQQTLTTAPSYYPEAREIPSIIRALATAGGALSAAVIYNVIRLKKEPALKNLFISNFLNFRLWKYVGALQFFNLIFAYTLFYPGMDVMAKAGMGGMCYPMMVGSCIVSFTLTSVFILKEKVRSIQLIALGLCISGLVFICFPA